MPLSFLDLHALHLQVSIPHEWEVCQVGRGQYLSFYSRACQQKHMQAGWIPKVSQAYGTPVYSVLRPPARFGMLAELPPQAPHFTVKILSAIMAISQSSHNQHVIPQTFLFCDQRCRELYTSTFKLQSIGEECCCYFLFYGSADSINFNFASINESKRYACA